MIRRSFSSRFGLPQPLEPSTTDQAAADDPFGGIGEALEAGQAQAAETQAEPCGKTKEMREDGGDEPGEANESGREGMARAPL